MAQGTFSFRWSLAWSLVALGVAVSFPGSAHPRLLQKQTPLMVFGDSLVDTGNNDYIANTTIKANFKPYGKDRFPYGPTGRFSDGSILTDYLAGFLHVPTPPLFLAQPESAKRGVNFASAGSGILDTTNPEVLTLSKQLASFQGLVSSKMITPEVISSAVFLVSTGGNDLFGLPSDPSIIPQYVGQMVQGYIQFLEALVQSGAKRFVLLKLGPAGCAPFVRARGGTSGPLDCNEGLNQVVSSFNSALTSTLASTGLQAAAQFAAFDLFGYSINTYSNLKEFGLTTIDACCGGPGATYLVSCGQKKTINGTLVSYTLCKDADKQGFWDGAHPPQRLTKMVADAIWKGGSYTTPSGGVGSLFAA